MHCHRINSRLHHLLHHQCRVNNCCCVCLYCQLGLTCFDPCSLEQSARGAQVSDWWLLGTGISKSLGYDPANSNVSNSLSFKIETIPSHYCREYWPQAVITSIGACWDQSGNSTLFTSYTAWIEGVGSAHFTKCYVMTLFCVIWRECGSCSKSVL